MKRFPNVYRYGLVIAVCCIAIVVGWISGAQAICLLLAIMVSSLYGGKYPSLVGVGVAVLAFDFFFLTPRYDFSVTPTAYPRFVAFIAVAFTIRHLIRSREDKIRKNAKELRELIDFIPHHVLVLDPSGRILEANQMVLDYTGRTLEEMLNLETAERIRRDIHPDDIERVRGERQRSLSNGLPFEIEGRALGKDETYRWFHFRYKPLRDESGNVFRWFCTATDIEDMKRDEEELRLVVDTISTYLHTARPDGLVDFLNRRWLDYLGLPLEAALARCDVLGIRDPSELDLSLWDFQSVFHPDDVEEITAVWRRIVETKVVEDAYARIRRSDGTYRWFLFRECPRFDETGKLIKWYGAAIDIEDQKRAEEKLRQREIDIANQLRRVINTTPGLAWTAGPDGAADFLNQQWLEYAGLSMGEAMGWGFLVAVHPGDMPRLMEDWQRALRTGDLFETEGRVRRHDGEYRRFLFRARALRDKEGRITQWYGLNIDIDDIRKMQEELRKSEEKFRLMIDTIPALVWSATPEGGPEFINKRIATYAGVAEDQFSKVDLSQGDGSKCLSPIWYWRNMMHPDDFESALPIWAHCLSTGDSYNVEFRVRRSDGAFRWFQIRAEPFRDQSGKIINWYGIIVDIDDSRKMAEALRAAQTRLERATRIATVAELSASIAHEINQPLAAIVANGDACESWLSTDPPNLERARLAAERIIRDGNAAAEVIQRIRALFKQATPNKAALDMNEVIEEVLRLVANEVQRKHIIVQMELSQDLPRTSADRVQMQQLMINLVNNAIEAMDVVTDRPRTLFIFSKHEGAWTILIEVCDHGSGLADVERVFEPFFTTKEKGMGMGLSVCRSIIEAHEGSIWATQNEHRGTTFSFTLPILAENSE